MIKLEVMRHAKLIVSRSFSSLRPKPLDDVFMENVVLKQINPEHQVELKKFHNDYKKYYESNKEKSTADILKSGFATTMFIIIFTIYIGVITVGPDLYSDWRIGKVSKQHHKKEMDDLELKLKSWQLQQMKAEKKD